ncbi:MAG TPA: hypothetical protein VGZ47_12925 [Gemmataceae bacterium]|nr:hypothetical protein [Gemmataceae bacterium]
MRTPLPSTALLAGPYTPQALRKGGRAFCYYRDCDVVITSWSNGRISWPRARPIDGGGTTYLVDEELLRAIRTESSQALHYWWGAARGVVVKWRAALGVHRLNNPGTMRLNKLAVEASNAVTRGQRLTRKQVEERRERAIRLNLAQYIEPYRHVASRPWTAKELRALGKAPDEEVAARIGRTESAVRGKRCQLGIPKHDPWMRPWSVSELALLGTDDDVVIAEQLGRTVAAVQLKRWKLGVLRKWDRRRRR